MIDWPRHYTVVISCFNEAERIGSLVKQVRWYVSHVIVVDDGSTDTTEECARGAGANVVRLAKNGGKGAALRAGWQRAKEEGFRGC